MATVPYNPVPSIAPESRPTPRLSMQVPGAAFGTNIGEAKQHLGRSIQGAGDDISKVVLAYQELNNETWAKDKDVETMVQIGKAQSEFDQLQGKNAIEALPGHMERLKAIRQDALDASPNPAARRMLDNSIARRMGFAIVDSGNRAGQQAKVAANNASEARKQTAQSTATLSNPREFEEVTVPTIRAEVRQQGQEKGAAPETIANEERKEISRAFLNGIKRLASVDPERARVILEEKKDDLDADVREQAQIIVNRNMDLLGTRVDADDLMVGREVAGVKVPAFDASKGPGQLEPLLAAAKKVGESKGEGNPAYSNLLENRVRERVSLGLAAYRDTQLANDYTVKQYVLGKNENEKIASIDGVAGPNAPPEIRDAYNTLSPDKKIAIDRYIAQNNKTNIPYTPERQARYHQLVGMQRESPAKFAELNLLQEDLPRNKIDDLFRRQQAVLKRAEPNSEINTYIGNARVQSTLRAVGIKKGTPESSEAKQYDQFVGALEIRANEAKAAGTKIDDKWLNATTLDLVKQVVTPGVVWGTNDQRRFEVVVPKADAETIRTRFRAKHGYDPEESEIRSLYLKVQKFPESK